MKLIFLDIDGVLNAHEHCEHAKCNMIERRYVARLNTLLLRSDAKIVLSSAWRYLIHNGNMSLNGMEWLLRSHGVVADRLIGITAPDTMIQLEYNGDPTLWPVENERGAQITKWFNENTDITLRSISRQDFKYVVLDDLDLGISAAKHPFIHVDGRRGLTDTNVSDALYLLRN